jgi:plasmid maintenance system antidote protein VapI
MRLAACFGTSPEFWLNLQSQWELSKLRETRAGDYAFITKVTLNTHRTCNSHTR